MMRIHLKGLAIGLAVLLSVVLFVTLFNSIEPDENSRYELSLDRIESASDENKEDKQRHVLSRKGTRLRREENAVQSAEINGGGVDVRHSPTSMSLSKRNEQAEDDGGDGRRSEHANGMSIVSKPKAVAGRTGAKHGGASSRPNTRTMAARAGAGGRQLSGKASQNRKSVGSSKRKRPTYVSGNEGKKKPKRKPEPDYPDWWKLSFPRSSVVPLMEEFVGDQPLFDECPTFDSGQGGVKIKRYGPVNAPNFVQNSKNPCWFEWNGRKDSLKCVPYFYLAGVPNAATNDLFTRLAHHPSVMGGGILNHNWWDRRRYGASKQLKYTKETKRTDDPVNLKEFAKEVVGNHGKNITKALLYLGKSVSIFGDVSPSYLVENTQWSVFEGNEGCSEPRVIPSTFMRHMFPSAKIIIILRNPVQRVYSRFLSNIPYVMEYENRTDSLFHTFTMQAVQNYRQCFASTSVRHCAYNSTLFSEAVIRLSEGMYPIFLEDWFRVFPRDQILILMFEEYVKDIKGNILKVFDFLGLNALDEYQMQKISRLPAVRRDRGGDESRMLPETETVLTEFYEAFLQKLSHLLDDEKWLYMNSVQTIAVLPPEEVLPVDVKQQNSINEETQSDFSAGSLAVDEGENHDSALIENKTITDTSDNNDINKDMENRKGIEYQQEKGDQVDMKKAVLGPQSREETDETGNDIKENDEIKK